MKPEPSTGRRDPSELMGLLQDCRAIAAEQLPVSLHQVMRSIDAVLYDSADKAETEQMHELYSNAMHELRDKRDLIESEFRRRFIHAFNTSLRTSVRANEHFDGEQTVIKQAAAEEELTVTRMVEQIQTGCRDELLSLDRRMGVLLNDPEFRRLKNPIRPEAICRALQDACGGIECGAEVKVLLLKLFNRYMNSAVRDLYQHLNGRLAELDLPSIEQRAQETGKIGNDGGGGGSGEYREVMDKSLVSIDLDELRALAQRKLDSPLKASASTASRAMLVAALTKLQQGNLASLQDSADHVRARPVNVLHAINSSKLGKQLDPQDRLTLVIVAIMFDHFLNDRTIPPAIRPLLGRLQIPVLKVALLDESVFSSRSHPTRRLIDLIAQSTLAWSEALDSDKALYEQVQGTIYTVLSKFGDDLSIFAGLADSLEEATISTEREARAQASKIAVSADFSARARSMAKDVVAAQLEEVIAPDFLAAFLKGTWTDALAKDFLIGGIDGDVWERDIQSMDDLLWSTQLKETSEERQRLKELLPDLIENLKRAMAEAGVEPDEQTEFLTKLAKVHARVVSEEGADALDIDAQREEETEKSSEFFLDRMDQLFGGDEVQSPEDEELTLIDEIASKLEDDEFMDEDEEATSNKVKTTDPFLKLVESLSLGALIEFQESTEQGFGIRGCLIWKAKDGNQFIFGSCRGLKIAEYSGSELAEQFRQRKARMIQIPEQPLFDRAVEYVMEICGTN